MQHPRADAIPSRILPGIVFQGNFVSDAQPALARICARAGCARHIQTKSVGAVETPSAIVYFGLRNFPFVTSI